MRSGAGLLLALGAAGVLLLHLLLLLRRARRALPAEGKAVLITGCDKGFGHALAKCLHAKGFTVFAGCLLMDENGDGARELRNMKSDRMKVLQMDVCSDQEVAQAVDFVKRTLQEPEEGLWGLVNNAGISTFGEVEFASLDNYKKVAEVNLWGTVRVTKAFLPLIRRAKGRVVNITSMLGRMASPSRSCYCVSKFGVAAFSDCLRQEMYRWGVRVVLVEPSNFVAATGILTAASVDRQAQALWSGGQPRRAAGLRQRALRSPRGHHEVLREQWPEGHVSGLECHHRSAHVPVPQEPLQPHGDVLVGEAAGHDPPAHSHCRLALHPRSQAVNRHPSGIPPGLTHRLGLISALLAAVSPLEMHMLPL